MDPGTKSMESVIKTYGYPYGGKKERKKTGGKRGKGGKKISGIRKRKLLRFTSLEGLQDGKGSGGKGRALSAPHLSSFPVCDPWLLAARGRQHIKKIIYFFLIARFSLVLR